MGVTIKNLSSRPLYVPLHNGQNVRLAAGASSDEVDEVLVKGHITVDKLVKQRVIAIDAGAKAKSGQSAAPETPELAEPAKTASGEPPSHPEAH
jgi:hypothetical protein